MTSVADEARLSRIQTLWTQMLSPGQATDDSTRRLLLRYHVFYAMPPLALALSSWGDGAAIPFSLLSRPGVLM